jgi:hypothetical protein
MFLSAKRLGFSSGILIGFSSGTSNGRGKSVAVGWRESKQFFVRYFCDIFNFEFSFALASLVRPK